VTFTASDIGLGVDRTLWRLDGGVAAVGTATVVDVPGHHTIEYWSVDLAGNVEAGQTIDFIVSDIIPPVTISDRKPVYYGGMATITLQASDVGTGVAATLWALDGSASTTGTVVTTTDAGDHTLEFRSVDLEGNEEATKTVGFRLYGNLSTERVAGGNRYATAIALSQAAFGAGSVQTAVVASGEDDPDALTAAGLAGVFECPLLLTARSRVPDGVITELNRLGAETVVIVGGGAAVGDDVAATLSGAGFAVERIQGADRYSTARAVAERMETELGALPETAFVVRSDGYADALAVSPVA
jgi:hypothetical protein